MAKQYVSDEDARVELSRARDLARRVRRSQRATWFPLLVFALLTFAAMPVSHLGHPIRTVCAAMPGAGPGAQVCLVHNTAIFIYWPIALVAAYAAIAAFYARQSTARGIGTRVHVYVVVGLVLAVAVTAASVWARHHLLVNQYNLLGWHVRSPEIYRLIAPACAIGLALLVLAAVERNLALLAVTVIYLLITVLNVGTMHTSSPWAYTPHVLLQGGVLLLAALGFAATQRRSRHGAA